MLEFNTSGMVRHEIFSWNSTHLGWYVMRNHALFGKNPSEVREQLSRLFADYRKLGEHAVDENKSHALK